MEGLSREFIAPVRSALEMPVSPLAQPVLGHALLDSVLAPFVAPGTGAELGSFLDQGRGVPWGGVLTVLGGWAQALLT